MMKLLNLLWICVVLLDICWVTLEQQTSLKRKRDSDERDLSEKQPSVTKKHDGNEERKRTLVKLVTSKPKAKERLITPDMIMPQPLNLRINKNIKPKYTEGHGRKQGKTSINKDHASPVHKTQPVISDLKNNETDKHNTFTIDIPKSDNRDHINIKNDFYVEVDENDSYINKHDDSHQEDKKIAEHLYDRTEPDSQSVVTDTTAKNLKSHATSHVEKYVKKESDDDLTKILTNIFKSIVSNNTDSFKNNTERTKPHTIANYEDTENKIRKKENEIELPINKTQSVKNINPSITPKSQPQTPVLHDNTYSAKIELDVDPKIMADIIKDPKDKIVIKNHDYEEVYKRDNFGPGSNFYQEVEYPNCNVNYVEPVDNTNEAYAPDTTFIKLPYKYPLENDINDLCGNKPDTEVQQENSSAEVTSRDRIWRTWKNTEIYIKSSNIERNNTNKDTVNPDKDTNRTFAYQMMPTTCSWYYLPQYRRYCYPALNYNTSYLCRNYY